MSRREPPPIAPRMLTAEQAAAYLGYETTGLLANIPVKPVRMVESGAGCMPKYDRFALDAWLDRLSGLSVPAAGQAGANGGDATAAVARDLLAGRRVGARRSRLFGG
jgi:hypothetical protein